MRIALVQCSGVELTWRRRRPAMRRARRASFFWLLFVVRDVTARGGGRHDRPGEEQGLIEARAKTRCVQEPGRGRADDANKTDRRRLARRRRIARRRGPPLEWSEKVGRAGGSRRPWQALASRERAPVGARRARRPRPRRTRSVGTAFGTNPRRPAWRVTTRAGGRRGPAPGADERAGGGRGAGAGAGGRGRLPHTFGPPSHASAVYFSGSRGHFLPLHYNVKATVHPVNAQCGLLNATRESGRSALKR